MEQKKRNKDSNDSIKFRGKLEVVRQSLTTYDEIYLKHVFSLYTCSYFTQNSVFIFDIFLLNRSLSKS